MPRGRWPTNRTDHLGLLFRQVRSSICSKVFTQALALPLEWGIVDLVEI